MIGQDTDGPVPFAVFVTRLNELDELEAVYIDPKRPLTKDSLTVASSPMLGRETIENDLGFAYVADVAEFTYLIEEYGSDLQGALDEIESELLE